MKYIAEKCEKKEQILLFLTGGAGVGKTYLLKLIADYWRLTQAKFAGIDPTLLLAPTGLAAKNIEGRTIHSALKLPVQHGAQPKFYPLTDRPRRVLQSELSQKSLLIIDEISMVSAETLEHVHRRLTEVKDESKYFGGISIILSGDFFQLPPIRGQLAFTADLFGLFDHLWLKENVRQLEDKTWCKCLNRIRLGTVNTEDKKLLSSRVFTKQNLEEIESDLTNKSTYFQKKIRKLKDESDTQFKTRLFWHLKKKNPWKSEIKSVHTS